MKNRDLHSSLCWIGVAILFLIGALQQGLEKEGIPGAGFLPFITGIILIALSLMVLIHALGNKKEEGGAIGKAKFFPRRDSLKKILLALIALFAYEFSLEYLGYLITTFLFMLFITRLIEPQRWRMVFILALSTTMLSYLLFIALLKVQLPKGILRI